MADFLHPDRAIAKYGETLPHWQQDEVMQFVTFRLGDSIPVLQRRQWKEDRDTWLKMNPERWTPKQEKEYHQRFTAAFESMLDAGMGSCLLKHPANRKCVEETFQKDEGVRALHHAWVSMPNHVHLLFVPLVPIGQLMKSWKGVSSRKIGGVSIWQKNYRDTLIRDIDHFINAVRYIRRNPEKLPPGTFTLWQSERALAIT